MTHHNHPLSELFAQLGLAHDAQAIVAFIRQHAPLDTAQRLEEAAFWNASQRVFLHQARSEDADWAEVVDLLDAELRHRG